MHSISRKTSFWLGLGLMVAVTGCKDDDDTTSLGQPPTQAQAAFTYAISAANANSVDFTAVSSGLAASWDFGNGSTGSGTTISSSYPFAGDYDVTLTVQNSGGSASTTQTITIAQDDPTLINNPLYDLLTGGAAGPGSKTWAVDSASEAHFGVGPDPIGGAGEYPEWYAASINEKVGAGMYDDRYTFKVQGFGFDAVTNGDVYVNSGHAGDAPFDDTAATSVGDFSANFPDQLGETWTIDEGAADSTLTISGNAMIGYWAGTRTYSIVRVSENELFLRFTDTKASNPGLNWYVRLVPVGFNSNPNPPVNYSLPLDFETVEPSWQVFEGNGYQYISNPDMSGINTSSKVMEVTHGNQTFSGMFVNLDAKLDFSTDNLIKIKVWAPDTGTFRLKVENQANPASNIEIDASVTTKNAWQELSFDLTGAPTDLDRIVIFPGWGTTTPDLYYIDDIIQD